MNKITKSILAGGTIRAGRFVALSAGLVVEATSASSTIIGISERACASGEICEVTIQGLARLSFAGTVAAGGFVKSDSNGEGVAATAGALAHARYIGQTSTTDATIPSAVDNDIKEVVLLPEGLLYFAGVQLRQSVTVDFGSITNATTGTATATVTGAASGDEVVVNAPSLEADLVLGNAHVSAANTVTIRIGNISAAPINPASQAFIITVRPAA